MTPDLSDDDKATLIEHAAQYGREFDEVARKLHQLIEEVEIVAGHLVFSQPQASSRWWLWWRHARDLRRFDTWLNAVAERLDAAIEAAKPRYMDGGMVTRDDKAKPGTAGSPKGKTGGPSDSL